ncbi:MAG TPA: recombinase family protein [Chitinophagales bacterium]|nr:recombinase family protein [Chitinophagales bacterium]
MIVIYLRVSSEEQEKSGLGLEAQLIACQDYCTNNNFNIQGIFTDIISGKIDPQKRKGFMEAIKIAKSKNCPIITAKQDRFSREVSHVALYFNNTMFGKKTPKLIFADSPNASIFEINIKASLSQEERRLIGIRTREALARAKARGKELGKVGREIANKKRQLALNNVMNRARDLYNDGKGYAEIATILNNEGLRNIAGKNWTRMNIYNRLKTKLKTAFVNQ